MSVKRTKPLTSVITGMVSQFATVFAASKPAHLARQYRTVRHFVAFFGTIEFVDQFQFSITGSDNQFTAGVHNRLHVAEL